MKIAYGIDAKRVSILLDGRYRSLLRGSENGTKLIEVLKRGDLSDNDLDQVRLLVDIPAYVAAHTFGRVVIDDHENVRLDGKKVDFGVVTALKRTLAEGFDTSPLVRFLENVSENPDETIATSLYPFLEKGNHPFTEDGCFLAFKRVADNYHSISSGIGGSHLEPGGIEWETTTSTVKYPLGGWARMAREDCDPNQGTVCANGLHMCSFEYLKGFHGGRGRILICKINPRDVTAFPSRYEAKFRCCLVEIVGEIPEADAGEYFQSAVDRRHPTMPPPHDWFAEGKIQGIKDGETDRTNEFPFEPDVGTSYPDDITDPARPVWARGYIEGYPVGFGVQDLPEGDIELTIDK